MRDIKFKQYIGNDNPISEEHRWICTGIYSPFIHDREDYGQTFAEYTEIKDDNGIEIYEGDILSNCCMDGYEGCTGLIVRKDYAWKIKSGGVYRPLMDNQGWCSIRESRYGGVKVIGNKWETPELLRSKRS